MPAIAARAVVRKSGANPVIPALVAGREPLKISTPINPLIQPCVERETVVIALSILYSVNYVLLLQRVMRIIMTIKKLSWIHLYGNTAL